MSILKRARTLKTCSHIGNLNCGSLLFQIGSRQIFIELLILLVIVVVFGVVIRDSDATMRSELVYSPDIVEAAAVKVVTELAREFSLSPIVLESDCLKLVKVTQTKDDDDSGFGITVAYIRHNMALLSCSFCVHVSKEANLVAHGAAKFALFIRDLLSLVWCCPIHRSRLPSLHL
ncbi:hypothetical protein ACLB2K_034973 [Fragaria x ananassa]